MGKIIIKTILVAAEPFILLFLLACAVAARFYPKAVDIGLGPLPLINNIYHKKVFVRAGYSAETFVNQVWHITDDFDVRADTHPLTRLPKIGHRINALRLAAWVLFRYRCVVMYFNGGVFGVSNSLFLWRAEPFLFRIAGVKTIILPYGLDVQDMSRSPNLLFKDALSRDYPQHKFQRSRVAGQIDLWTSYGDHVIGGCEWVDYMHHWDTLMISHFSIDEKSWDSAPAPVLSGATFKVLHAPNHRAIKGTAHVIAAVEELKREGLDIELTLIEKRPNHEVRELIRNCDVVVDQLIVGWYAMFAIEAMALQKPVICHHRRDLEDLYKTAGLLGRDEEIPLIQSSPLAITDTLRRLYNNRGELARAAAAGREYVLRHHSIDAIARTFGPIAQSLIGSPTAQQASQSK